MSPLLALFPSQSHLSTLIGLLRMAGRCLRSMTGVDVQLRIMEKKLMLIMNLHSCIICHLIIIYSTSILSS